MKHTVLLLGGSGFIGVNMIEYFMEKKYQVIVYGRTKPPVGDVIFIDANLKDIKKYKDILASFRIHAALYLINTFPINSKCNGYKSLLYLNQEVISTVFDVVERFIFFSSGGRVYQSSNEPHKENDRLIASCDYGKSKIELEQFVQNISKVKCKPFLIIRPSNPYGPYQSSVGTQGLIAVLIKNIMEGKEVEIWGTGYEVRDYIYIKDFVSLFARLYDKANPKYDIYNIGSGKGVSTFSILDAVKKNLPEYKIVTKRISVSNIITSNILCTRRLYDEIGFEAYTELESGIANYIFWFRSLRNK